MWSRFHNRYKLWTLYDGIFWTVHDIFWYVRFVFISYWYICPPCPMWNINNVSSDLDLDIIFYNFRKILQAVPTLGYFTLSNRVMFFVFKTKLTNQTRLQPLSCGTDVWFPAYNTNQFQERFCYSSMFRAR